MTTITGAAPTRVGAVRSVAAAQPLTGALKAAAEAQDLANGPRRPRIKAIIERAAQRHGCSVEQLMSRSRERRLVDARNDAIRTVAAVFPDFSTPHLGEIFGGRDHTTILHALGRTAASQKVARRK